MKIGKTKQFIFVFCAFVILGAAFKVMSLVEGFTEVRPVNAIPIIAGLAFGPIGALACGIGNAVADLFGNFDLSSILGVIGNFVAAYLPYKIWHVYSKEKPNLHTYRNIALFIAISIVSALTISFLLAFGLEIFFDTWIATIYLYVFYNNTCFSIALGMPLFIVLTSEGISLECVKKPNSFLPEKLVGYKKWIFPIYAVIMLIILAGVFMGAHLGSSVVMIPISIVAVVLLIYLLL